MQSLWLAHSYVEKYLCRSIKIRYHSSRWLCLDQILAYSTSSYVKRALFSLWQAGNDNYYLSKERKRYSWSLLLVSLWIISCQGTQCRFRDWTTDATRYILSLRMYAKVELKLLNNCIPYFFDHFHFFGSIVSLPRISSVSLLEQKGCQ